MSIGKENLLRHELIGLEAEVVGGNNPTVVGKKGTIVNETMNTLTIEENEDLKVLPKSEIELSVELPEGQKVKVDGRELVARPEDRIKN